MTFKDLHEQMQAPLMPTPFPNTEELRRYFAEILSEADRLEVASFLRPRLTDAAPLSSWTGKKLPTSRP